MKRYVNDPNPAPGVDRHMDDDGRVWEDTDSQRQIIDPLTVSQSQPDLLGPVGQEVDRLGEFADLRVRVALQWDGELGRLLALLDSFKGELAACGHGHGISFDGCTPNHASVGPAPDGDPES